MDILVEYNSRIRKFYFGDEDDIQRMPVHSSSRRTSGGSASRDRTREILVVPVSSLRIVEFTRITPEIYRNLNIHRDGDYICGVLNIKHVYQYTNVSNGDPSGPYYLASRSVSEIKDFESQLAGNRIMLCSADYPELSKERMDDLMKVASREVDRILRGSSTRFHSTSHQRELTQGYVEYANSLQLFDGPEELDDSPDITSNYWAAAVEAFDESGSSRVSEGSVEPLELMDHLELEGSEWNSDDMEEVMEIFGNGFEGEPSEGDSDQSIAPASVNSFGTLDELDEFGDLGELEGLDGLGEIDDLDELERVFESRGEDDRQEQEPFGDLLEGLDRFGNLEGLDSFDSLDNFDNFDNLDQLNVLKDTDDNYLDFDFDNQDDLFERILGSNGFSGSNGDDSENDHANEGLEPFKFKDDKSEEGSEDEGLSVVEELVNEAMDISDEAEGTKSKLPLEVQKALDELVQRYDKLVNSATKRIGTRHSNLTVSELTKYFYQIFGYRPFGLTSAQVAAKLLEFVRQNSQL